MRELKTDQWNLLINIAKNATFCFIVTLWNTIKIDLRISKSIYENENLVRWCPANRVERSCILHQGLTYGGLVKIQSKWRNSFKPIGY
jgi:hypothetical protein